MEALLNRAGLNATSFIKKSFYTFGLRPVLMGTEFYLCLNGLHHCRVFLGEGRLIGNHARVHHQAKAKGIVLMKKNLSVPHGLVVGHPSMHQDLVQQKRLTEIDHQWGCKRMGPMKHWYTLLQDGDWSSFMLRCQISPCLDPGGQSLDT